MDNNEYFIAMLAGHHGVEALDVARAMESLAENNIRLTSELEKWQKQATETADKLSMMIDEKSGIEAKHKALKDTLAEMAK